MALTPAEAAEIIGCSPSHVYTLIYKGRLKAWRKVLYRSKDKDRTVYVVLRSDVEKYRDTPQVRGWPRGRRRKQRT